jgi:hypothetical protein
MSRPWQGATPAAEAVEFSPEIIQALGNLLKIRNDDRVRVCASPPMGEPAEPTPSMMTG